MGIPFRKIGSILTTLAPTMALALGPTGAGPLAGMAVSALAKAVTGDPKADPAAVESAVLSTTDPQTYAKIQQADNEFKLSMEQAGIDLEKVMEADRASAREREVQVKDKTPRNLAYISIFLFGSFSMFGIIVYMKENLDATKLTALVGFISTILGFSIGLLKQAFNFFFGTSQGSSDKTAIISQVIGAKAP